MSIEKQTLKERLERELRIAKETSQARVDSLIAEHNAKVETINQASFTLTDKINPVITSNCKVVLSEMAYRLNLADNRYMTKAD